jgi:ABC-type polysaccharide/polyol phosphate transport system ATPase subunit
MASILFENVDLEYPLRGPRITFKEYLVRGLFRRGRRAPRPMIHALKDVSFHVGEGERVGIIGHNGAGKSTLLRTVGGIYPVARGRKVVEGSICSLFDIALGFEKEATGWQNIRYRSYLQGETPQTIAAKLPDIADFCELGEFLDLPLRCYSQGMVMRLAFSIATSSAPEILLIDEVFATGDLAFRKKAEARLRDFMNRAKIVIVVGHDLEFLKEFCERVLWLDHGSVRAEGPAHAVIDEYVRTVESQPKPAQAA